MTDLTQRARDVAGRMLERQVLREEPGVRVKIDGVWIQASGSTLTQSFNRDGPEAAAIISELVGRIEGVWQGIETAPRDEWILAYQASDNTEVTGDYYAARYSSVCNYWLSRCGQEVTEFPHPTAWMPLPPPPSVLGKQEGEG